MSDEATRYGPGGVQVPEGREAVRKRPGMYLGSTGERGLLTMVFEVADRAVNEAADGRATRVGVTLTPDGGVWVADDGTGFPTALEALLTRVRTGARAGGRHDVMLGRDGVGPAVVNALSQRMTAEVRRGGVRWVQEYTRGVAATPVTEAGTATGSGTTITFRPDPGIFGSVEFSFDGLEERFRELAFLNQGLDISLTDRRRPNAPRSVRLRFPGGVRDFVAFLDPHPGAPAPMDAIAFEREDTRMAGTMEVAFRWCACPGERIRSYANSRPTSGGSHVAGFRDGIAAALTAYARERGLPAATDPEKYEGLTAVVSVKLDRPEFEGATRSWLGNAEVRARVGQAVQDHLGRWLKAHPEQAAAIIDR